MKSEKTNKKWIISLSILTGVVFILSISLLTLTLQQYSSSKQTEAPAPVAANTTPANAEVSETDNSSSAEEPMEEIYIVKNYNGKIGIFIKGDENPFQVIDIDPSLLPEKDQEELSDGLEIKGAENLRQIIEDFDG